MYLPVSSSELVAVRFLWALSFAEPPELACYPLIHVSVSSFLWLFSVTIYQPVLLLTVLSRCVSFIASFSALNSAAVPLLLAQTSVCLLFPSVPFIWFVWDWLAAVNHWPLHETSSGLATQRKPLVYHWTSDRRAVTDTKVKASSDWRQKTWRETAFLHETEAKTESKRVVCGSTDFKVCYESHTSLRLRLRSFKLHDQILFFTYFILHVLQFIQYLLCTV